MPSLPDRPEVLTEEVRDSILFLMRMGNYYEVACVASGVSRETVEYWRRLVEAGVEHAQKYADFFTALKKNAAIAEAEALKDIRSGADAWQSRAWFLERRYPKRWGRTVVEGHDPEPTKQEQLSPSMQAALESFGYTGPTGDGVGEHKPGALRGTGESGPVEVRENQAPPSTE